jgi:hypothetical protein
MCTLLAQRSVHMAVAVLQKTREQSALLSLPYELVELVLKHVV